LPPKIRDDQKNEKEVLSIISRNNIQQIPQSQVPAKFKKALANIERFGLIEKEQGFLCHKSQLFSYWLKEGLENESI
jgi:hypothetical protein